MEDRKIMVISDVDEISSNVTHIGRDELEEDAIPNIAEYDKVILDFVWDQEGLEKIVESSNISLDRIHKLLWSEGDLFLIIPTSHHYELAKRDFKVSEFLPIDYVGWGWDKGNTIKDIEESYQGYYNSVAGWNFYLAESPDISTDTLDTLIPRFNGGSPMRYGKTLVSEEAYNGFDEPVSFSIRYGYKIEKLGRNRENEVEYSGSMVFLQKPQNKRKAIKSLLKSLSLKITSSRPEWANKFFLPNMEAIDEEIQELKDEKKKVQEKIDNQRAELESEESFRKLLYEEGDELRDIVWKALSEIGFDVDEYDQMDEDGAVDTERGKYVIEVKGTTRAAKTKYVRQLNDHINRYLEREHEEPGGILVVNHFRKKKPESRGDAFSGDVKKAIQSSQRDIIALTSYELFNIIQRIQSSEISREEAREEILHRELE